jgi:hypothetical protein
MAIDVPPEFAQLGYTGLFHAEATMTMEPHEIEEWRTRVPCLLGNTGWMALRVTDDGAAMVVVRRDGNAMWDLVTIRRP